ncbi:FadR/GntR family transcriptional regulator [Sphingopyxis sp. JAI128]|uniref:FadR/GntR family transcriptional regulator n=1 Tax=Sphingopyxis sp. JAI128 TaxID=2723066 RepID=UPI001836F3DE|nr:FadR/GntR family transcriptional regulator [Sphingopyxis sp. JAI128]MBB6427826.1 DNA-binding FadR family transcriptional regulator [Sphingopyxis sp. JAI128]
MSMDDLTASKGFHPAPDGKRLRIHGSVARDLGIAIVSGRYSPGELLLGEIEASERLKISRTAYREALRILSAKGLVESRPKTGTKVSARFKWHMLDPDVLQWIFELEPSDSLLESLFELRRVVEPEAAALAAKRRADDHVARMDKALEAMKEHTLATEAGRQADQDFHAALLEASGNPFLITLTSGVGAAVAWTTVFKQRHAPLRRDPIPDHRRVFDAVAAGDSEASRAAMTDLVNMAFHDTRGALMAASAP